MSTIVFHFLDLRRAIRSAILGAILGASGVGHAMPIENDASAAETLTLSNFGVIDTNNEFFQELGTNGRTCGSCHLETEGWSITPAGLRARFFLTMGLDPVFRAHDGANAPQLDVSTFGARREAYSLLLDRGVIRIGLPVRADAQFELLAVDDPYGHASAAQLSLFRRPLPTTNLRFNTAVNWDGRNTPDQSNMMQGLLNQSNGATVNHAQASAPLGLSVRERIVGFEVGLHTAQIFAEEAGRLDASGARGGPRALSSQAFAIGANDPSSPGFNRRVFNLFDAWTGRQGKRGEIADGQRIFNEKTFDTGGGRVGTCSGCHSVPNVGNSSSFVFFDIGTSDPSRRSADMPLYTFRNKTTGHVIQTTDPGRALITGRWADMNRFKVPGLRGLPAHPPYFHDGSAKTVEEVVEHYKDRFHIKFRKGEKDHLVRFLKAL